MRQRWRDFKEKGIDALAVSFDPVERLSDYREYLEIPFLMASDPTREGYEAYGLTQGSFFQVWHPRTLWMYVKLVFRGRKLKKPKKDEDLSQLGGDFLIDASGRLLFAHASVRPDDRPPVEDILSSV